MDGSSRCGSSYLYSQPSPFMELMKYEVIQGHRHHHGRRHRRRRLHFKDVGNRKELAGGVFASSIK